MEQPDYQQQAKTNETIFKDIAREVRPDMWSLMDAVDGTGVNYVVLLKVIYALNNVATGTKYGTVSVDIQDGVVTFVRGTQNDRVNEPVVK